MPSPPKARVAIAALCLILSCLVVVLIACPPPSEQSDTSQLTARKPSAGQENPPTRPAPERPETRGRLAVIIDDAGYDLGELEPFLELPGPLTVAVLPNLPLSAEAARRVLAAGKDLLLHCPMEPRNGENPGPGALRTGQSQAEIRSLLASAFSSVSGAIGMNNHMGSKATADEALMTTVMEYLRREGKFFVDSRTTAETVAEGVAAKVGVPYLRRDVFIDAGRSAEEIARAFESGLETARTRGFAVMIGHVQNRGVLDILRKDWGRLAGEGVVLTRLSDIVKGRGNGSVE